MINVFVYDSSLDAMKLLRDEMSEIFPHSLSFITNVPDENNNNRPQSTLVDRDPLTTALSAPSSPLTMDLLKSKSTYCND